MQTNLNEHLIETLGRFLYGTDLHEEQLALATHLKTDKHWADVISLMSGRSTFGSDQQITKSSKKKVSKFKFIDLFAGIGGFRLGLEAQGGHSVFASEWDKTANDRIMFGESCSCFILNS